MKATLNDGTILEGNLEEVKTIIKELTVKGVVERTSIRRTEHANTIDFDAVIPKRKYNTKKSAKQIKKVCKKYAINETNYRTLLMDEKTSFDHIGKKLGIPPSAVYVSRKLLRKEGTITFRRAQTPARLKVYAQAAKRMRKASKLVRTGKAKTMIQAMKMLRR